MELLALLAHHGHEHRIHICALTGQKFQCGFTIGSGLCYCRKRTFGRNTLYWLNEDTYKKWDLDRSARIKQGIIDSRRPRICDDEDAASFGIHRLADGTYEKLGLREDDAVGMVLN